MSEPLPLFFSISMQIYKEANIIKDFHFLIKKNDKIFVCAFTLIFLTLHNSHALFLCFNLGKYKKLKKQSSSHQFKKYSPEFNILKYFKILSIFLNIWNCWSKAYKYVKCIQIKKYSLFVYSYWGGAQNTTSPPPPVCLGLNL